MLLMCNALYPTLFCFIDIICLCFMCFVLSSLFVILYEWILSTISPMCIFLSFPLSRCYFLLPCLPSVSIAPICSFSIPALSSFLYFITTDAKSNYYKGSFFVIFYLPWCPAFKSLLIPDKSR